MFLCPCPHGPVSPSVCLLPCVPVSPMSPCPCPFVPTLVSPSLCLHVPISPSLCPHVPVCPSPCPHLHVPVPVSLSPCPHVPMSLSLCSHVPILMSLCLQVPMSPCPFVPVPVSPYHPGLPVLSRELPSEGPYGLCRVGAGTRDRTCSPFFPDGRLIPSLSPQLRSLTLSLHRRPAVLPPPDPAGSSSTPGWHQKGPEVHFHLLSDCPATPGGPEHAGTFGGPEVLLSTTWGK